MNYLESIDFGQPDFGDWHDEVSLWSAPFGLMLLDRVRMQSGLTILDVGTGTGFIAIELAQRCGSTSKVIAVDPWTPGMRRLRRKLDRLNLTNIELLEQDAESINLPNDSVDVIVSNLGLNNFERPAAVLETCFRVAKPRAQLLLTTNISGHMSEFYEVFRGTLIQLGRDDRLPELDSHIGHRGTVESIRTVITDAGFIVERVDRCDLRMRFADGTAMLNHYFIRLGFVDGWKSVAPPDSVEVTFAALEANLNSFAAQQGELSLTVPMACFECIKS